MRAVRVGSVTAVVVAGLCLGACAGPRDAMAPVAPPAPPATPAAPASVTSIPPAPVAPDAAAVDFPRWRDEFRAYALSQGIRPATLDATLPGLTLLPRVVELDRKQPEGTVTFATYAARIVTDDRVRRGRALMKENAALMAQVAARYGVPARYLVALWSIESSYGKAMGNFRVLDSLATLAYEGRRAAFFRKELLAALRIVQDNGVDPAAMKGSWAGAMGQVQFMPSTYLKYAQDFDGCGRPDIWGRVPDVLSSAANYLASVGWRADQPWGREVVLPTGGLGDAAVGLDHPQPLAHWRRLGVKALGGGALPSGTQAMALVLPDGPTGRAFLVGDNYRTVMDWNRSTYFATAVGLLADRLGAAE